MNERIELLIRTGFRLLRGGEAVVTFAPAYIHRSTGRPGIDAGTGWLQSATFTLGEATLVAAPVSLPAAVSDGDLRIGTELHRNFTPTSGTYEGEIELSLVLVTVEALTIRGHRLSIEVHGEPSFVESFTP